MSRFPIPVVLCGRTLTVGKPVSEFLRPEYEVIHFIITPEAAIADIPLLLAGRGPQTTTHEIGTRNYSQPPRGVIFGRGFSQEFVHELKETCPGQSGAREPVAWLAGDQSKIPTGIPGPGYAKGVADSVKGVLANWLENIGDEDVSLLY
ncbi:uncharacterized protein BDV17DRAFT_275105 [Aspergillus undulatus]|uniref:uncharacterized protein n=1 Tax=Aspergillus undulatus TaxID=1810928 RepID=UPI003CCCFAB7